MAKKVTVEVEVNSTQLDKTVNKLGQLKDLGRGLKIQYDIDGKPIDIVLDKSLNLQKQVKILTAELRRTKEGTAEFQLLSTRLGDAQDQLAKTTAKSKDLFSTLSLLPGPVGDFFRQLQGGIELLKTFSSFTFKDLSFQLKETANDIADIGKNLSEVDSASVDEVTESNNDLAQSFGEVAAESNASSTAISNNTKAIQQLATTSGQYNEVIKQGGRLMMNSKIAMKDMTDAQVEAGMAERESMMTALKANKIDLLKIEASEEFQKLKEGEVVRINLATGALEKSVVVTKAANFWTTTLGTTIKTVLISTGILAAIVILGELITMLYNYVAGTKDAESATRDLTNALEEQQRVLQNDLDAIDMANKANITRAKIAGKTEAEITKLTKEGNQERLNALIKNENDLLALRDKLNKDTKIKGEEREKLSKDINDKILKAGQDITKQILSNEQFRLDEELRLKEKGREESKKIQDKKIDDTRTANDLLLKLQQENAVQILNTERKREDQQLKNEKENEEKTINRLKISEELRGKLIEQVRVKYGLKVIELNKKRQAEDNKTFDEDQKKIKEYQDKVFEIMNNADQNELSRNKATRTKKFEDDKAALEKDTNFQKETLENKIRILLALEKAYKNDLEKLDTDENQKNRENALKRLDDELRFLQIRGEAIIQGTREYFENLRTISKKSEERELKSLDDRAIKEKLTTEQVEAEKTAIKKKYATERTNIDKQELNSYLQYATAVLNAAQNIVSNISDINQMQQDIDLQKAQGNAEKQEEIKKKYFEKNKKTQVAQAVIGTLQSAVQAYQSLAVIPLVGPALGAAAAAAALIFGYKKVNLIKQQQYQSSSEGGGTEVPKPPMANFGRNYEKGGMIGGKRHAEGGTLIEAEKGEAIMTRGAVTMFAPLLSAMNQMGGGTSFAPSLVTTSFDSPNVTKPSQEQSPIIVKSYVVSNELTSEQQKQARLKDLSTL
jgi:hypothetical protein